MSIKKTHPMQAYKIMHGLWGMGQMMFTKYIVVVDDDVDVHNTSEVLFRLCANTDPQRDSIFTKGPADVLDHATSEIAVASKLGIDGMKVLPDEGFKRAWPPLIKMDESVKAKVENILSEGYHERHQAKLERWLSRRGICFHSGSLQKPRAGANPFLRNRSARRSAAERSKVRREAR